MAVVCWCWSLFIFLSMDLCKGDIVNLALDKPVASSSIYHEYNIPENAVDGNTQGVQPYVIHTDEGHTTAWWWVDLQTQVQDATVQIFFRTEHKGRRDGVQLYTSSTAFSTYPGGTLCDIIIGSNIPDIVNVTCNGTWSHLMVYRNKSNGDVNGVMLDFAEVEVLGCNRTYGAMCEKTCSSRQCAVVATLCDRYTGACPSGGCKSGWTGTDCRKECADDAYGANCLKSCSTRQCATSSPTCNSVTGECPGGCQAGWRGIDCTEKCADDAYGANCLKSCSIRQCATSSPTCNSVTGECPGDCQAGWRGIDCTETCSYSMFGVNCSEKCGHCKGNKSCDLVDGRCSEGCLDGYYGSLCHLASQADEPAKDPVWSWEEYLIGGLIGASVMLLVVFVVFKCLLRRGRLQWRARSRTNDSRPVVEMVAASNAVISPCVSGSSQPCSSSNMYSANPCSPFKNLDTARDSDTQSDNQDYDVIENIYENA